MNNKFFAASVGFLSTLLLSSLANAGSLGQFDARSLAMGSAGVAGANAANAAAYNPALMATEANSKSFSIIPFAISIEAVDENDFIDTLEDAEVTVNEEDVGLNALLDDLDGLEEGGDCGATGCYESPVLGAAALKADELTDHIDSLNKSNALLALHAGAAVQFGQSVPMALVIDGGASLRMGVKFAQSDTAELDSYTEFMQDGVLDNSDINEMLALGLITIDPVTKDIEFTRGEDDETTPEDESELDSIIEITGARFSEVGVSFADSFQYMDRELAIGISPKIVRVETAKYHQRVSEPDEQVNENGDEEDISDRVKNLERVSQSDLNIDVGVAFQPIESSSLQVGVTLKNLFSRSYELAKTDLELELEARAGGTGAAAEAAQADLAAFRFRQSLKIEPQLTAGIAYSLPLVNFLADIDLNAAEFLGRESQHISLGAEFDVRFFKLQAGYRMSIGGDNEDDAVSAGLGLGPVGLAVVSSGDQLGAVLQAGFSF